VQTSPHLTQRVRSIAAAFGASVHLVSDISLSGGAFAAAGREIVTMERNIEVKSQLRCSFDEAVQGISTMNGVIDKGILDQTDTYFSVPKGRLKLRETVGEPISTLIWYDRATAAAIRDSNYIKTPISQPAALKETLRCAGIATRGVVHKTRRLFLWHNVRIHLDKGRSRHHLQPLILAYCTAFWACTFTLHREVA